MKVPAGLPLIANQLWSYWEGLADNEGRRFRSAVTPRSMAGWPDLMRHALIHDGTEKGEPRLRFAGADLAEIYGIVEVRSGTETQPMSAPPLRNFLLKAFHVTLRHPCGITFVRIITPRGAAARCISTTHLPLLDDNGEVGFLLGVTERMTGFAVEAGGNDRLLSADWIDTGSGVPDQDPRTLCFKP